MIEKAPPNGKESEPKPLTEEELARWNNVWQATVYRNRGPEFVNQAQAGLRLIAEVRRLRQLVVEADRG